MTYDLLFRYKEHGKVPEERAQDDPITLEKGESVLIPEVGDHVTYRYEGRPTTFEVLQRHFNYFDHSCTVKVEVGHPLVREPLGSKE